MRKWISRLAVATAGAAVALVAMTCSGPSMPTTADFVPPIFEKSAQAFLPSPAWAKGETLTIADVAERTVGSVVNVSTEKALPRLSGHERGPGGSPHDPLFRFFFGPGGPEGMPPGGPDNSLGSGVVVSQDGLVLTNNHVIEKAERITVGFADGREFDAEVVGTDPDSDVGVLRLKGDLTGLKPITFGDSNALRLGDVVIAVGNPFGVGQTVTMGIVSAKGRANMGIVDYEDFIQTDAAINPGNSGGALVDMQGRLVGINTAIVSRSGGSQGIGFAIPSNMAKQIMDSLVSSGHVVRGWLGVAIQDVDRDLAKALGLANDQGVLIADVNPGSPADKGGLKRGDVVLKVGGELVDSSSRLRNLVAAAGKTTLRLVVRRDGKEKSLDVALGEKPSDAVAAWRGPSGKSDPLGLRLAPVDDAARRHFDLPEGTRGKVIVLEVAPGSAAARAGFRPGDVVLEVNRKPVDTPSEVGAALGKAEGTAAVLVQRGPSALFLALRKGG